MGRRGEAIGYGLNAGGGVGDRKGDVPRLDINVDH